MKIVISEVVQVKEGCQADNDGCRILDDQGVIAPEELRSSVFTHKYACIARIQLIHHPHHLLVIPQVFGRHQMIT